MGSEVTLQGTFSPQTLFVCGYLVDQPTMCKRMLNKNLPDPTMVCLFALQVGRLMLAVGPRLRLSSAPGGPLTREAMKLASPLATSAALLPALTVPQQSFLGE